MPEHIKFAKMHGLGNDFIVLDNLSGSCDKLDFVSFARKYCDRNFGIGADGVLIISKSKKADAQMRLINSDGSEAEMCGNGIRCVAKYLIDGNIAKSPVSVETLAGVMTIKNSGNGYTVDMGVPKVTATTAKITLNNKKAYTATLVDMGNPHAVIFVDDFDFDWQGDGKEIEKNKIFPNRTNVEFVKIKSGSELDVKVWERGAGATLACGTGACASLVASAANKKSGKKATVNLRGGSLELEWAANSRVFMAGPAELVFEGEIEKI